MLIYKITNQINGKIYIGKTEQTLEQRWARHLQDVGVVNRPLYNAIAKYGKENFALCVLEHCTSEQELCEKEIDWISKLHSTVLYGNYNISEGGGGGYLIKHWDDSRKQALYQQQANARRGQTRSEKTKSKLSKAATLREQNKTDNIKQQIKEKNSASMKRQYEVGLRVVNTPKLFGADHPGWVEIDIQSVLSLIQRGYTLKRIADLYNTSTVTVGARLKNETGHTYIEWKREYGVTRRISTN